MPQSKPDKAHALFQIYGGQRRANKVMEADKNWFCGTCNEGFDTEAARWEHQQEAGHRPKHPGGYDPNTRG